MSEAKDLLTKEERDALEWYEKRTVHSQHDVAIIAALHRLAPLPAPPETKVSELPAMWRLEADSVGPGSTEGRTLADCAASLEAALKRERGRLVQCPACAESYEAHALIEVGGETP